MDHFLLTDMFTYSMISIFKIFERESLETMRRSLKLEANVCWSVKEKKF